MQQLKQATAKIRDDYAQDLVQAFNWSEVDLAMDRETFCSWKQGNILRETVGKFEGEIIEGNILRETQFSGRETFSVKRRYF